MKNVIHLYINKSYSIFKLYFSVFRFCPYEKKIVVCKRNDVTQTSEQYLN